MVILFQRTYLLNLIRNKGKPDNKTFKHKALGRYHFSTTLAPSGDIAYFKAAYLKVEVYQIHFLH